MATATKKTTKKTTTKTSTKTSEKEFEKAFSEKPIITPIVRASFPYVHKPDVGGKYSDNKYKLTHMLEKEREDELKTLKQDCFKVAKKSWPNIKFNELEHPFKDGDESNDTNAHGHIVFNAKSNRKPGVVGPTREPLDEDQEVYGGCYVRSSLVAHSYTRPTELIVEKNGKRTKQKETIRGVGLYLNNVQFVKDGERFGGGSSPTEDFDEIDPSEFEGDDDLDVENLDDAIPAQADDMEEVDEDEGEGLFD